MKIELVTHCWAKDNPHFAGALVLQLSSILIDQPKHCDVVMTICMNEDDENTVRVVRHFMKRQHSGFRIQALSMPTNQLGRRSIGRNYAALHSNADFVWFTDVDHCFCDGVLDRLVQLGWPSSKADDGSMLPASMIFPGEIQISKNWDLGDEATENVWQQPKLKSIDKVDFAPKKYNKAIGGVQIVRGSLAREYGYLNNEAKWQTPAEKPFASFADDIAYRDFCKGYGPIVKVSLPGVHRLRHNETSYEAGKTPEDNQKELAKHR